MRAKEELASLYADHFQTVWNLCRTILPQQADVEDAVQETFVRLALSSTVFQSPAHAKAWLITTARRICLDQLRRAERKNVPLESAPEPVTCAPEPDETLNQLLALPEPYKTALYLFYYEQYSTKEIARLMGRREATVRSDLRRGRILLKQRLEVEG